jgi:NADP-dependent 3-hydroxy acid dehydrogenase YdfG
MSEIEGKVIAITGASSGIGEATARLLTERGTKVTLGARRTERLKALAADLHNQGSQAEYQALDVTRREEMASFVNFARERFGRLDVLISNAGLMPLSPLDQLKVEEWDRMIDVNIKGVLYGTAAALPVSGRKGAVTSSTSHPSLACGSGRPWRSTPEPSSRFGRSRKGCAKRRETSCG